MKSVRQLLCRCAGAGWLAIGPAAAQALAAPPPAAPPLRTLLADGDLLLQREDPLRAWAVFRLLQQQAPEQPAGLLGLGRAHLMLGHAAIASAYAGCVLQQLPDDQQAMALLVRAMIRARLFDAAVAQADLCVGAVTAPAAELLAARASALFRVQRIEDAAAAYLQVLALDPDCAEAHLRLGSGLWSRARPLPQAELPAAVTAARRGDLQAALAVLRAHLATAADDPVAHRLLGEVLFEQKARDSMAGTEDCFRALAAALPQPDLGRLPVAEFLPGYGELSPRRRAVADRALALFGRRLDQLVAIGARHDLLRELDRTTDSPERHSLHGKRTFDGRVWDDVRGIGGLHAATGIEALDEAAQFGFCTLSHELAHQVHYYALLPLDRVQIRTLYGKAKAAGRCLDFYAASNEAEYFGQGIEAFAALGKRPACETTHGHTRFELYQRDRELYDFIAGLVDFDPLRDPVAAPVLLRAAVAVALRCGRPEDAVVAAGMLPDGADKLQLLFAASIAEALQRAW